MSERYARTPTGTIGWVAANDSAAEDGARRLRTAGFADVRLSEAAGTTNDAHVPSEAGLTTADFAQRLQDAGFETADARAMTEAVARGGVLLTLAAGGHVEDALAVLRGGTIPGRIVSPVDFKPASDIPVKQPDAPSRRESTTSHGDDAAVDANAQAPDIVGVMPLREERLDVVKERQRGEARVRKEVVTEERTITVPVSREELVIEREGEDDVRVPLNET